VTTAFILGGIALLTVVAAAGLMLARRSGAGLVADTGVDVGAARLRVRKRLLVLLILVFVGTGAAVGVFWPSTHGGQPLNTATSRW
jgi:hypothetical protein